MTLGWKLQDTVDKHQCHVHTCPFPVRITILQASVRARTTGRHCCYSDDETKLEVWLGNVL